MSSLVVDDFHPKGGGSKDSIITGTYITPSKDERIEPEKSWLSLEDDVPFPRGGVMTQVPCESSRVCFVELTDQRTLVHGKHS